jgi:Asp-tRNA(Asn)/Glu-tRNA(Gln) amidotransferase A subunit family amidase
MSEPTVRELAEQVRAGERSSLDLVEDVLAAIDERNAELNAFVFVDADGARSRAEAVD